ncbi:MAG: DUF1559 domain-containing protein [Armatimonadetes bacterium]|nr:DUF1559 domain-containing protein [Armatimonadota bacterium]
MRRKGFTLIELLVVIAIIGILAAMVFPVFARARESARKVVCLSNVKNIALAMQMYLNDYDMTPPREHRSEVINWMVDKTGDTSAAFLLKVDRVNPYLAWPVIFDEYTGNRDMWRCPSGLIEWGAMFINGDPNWFREFTAYESPSGCGFIAAPCSTQTFPNGWGGDVTDSYQQGTWASTGNFVQNYAMTKSSREMKFSSIEDPSNYVAVYEAPREDLNGDYVESAAFPNVCMYACGGCNDNCNEAFDPASCPTPVQDDCMGSTAAKSDSTISRKWTRHLGGSNLGFMDGHAAWWSAQQIFAEAPRWPHGWSWTGYGPLVYRKLHGLTPRAITSAAGCAEDGIEEGYIPPASSCCHCGVVSY